MLKNILLNLFFISISLVFLLSLVWVGFALGTVYQKKVDDSQAFFNCPKNMICLIPNPGEDQLLFPLGGKNG